MRRRVWAALCGIGLLAAGAAAWAELLDFSPAERHAIARHGPWPPPPARDPGNGAAGRPGAIAYGHVLFADAGLSPDATLGCSSCHGTDNAYSDGRQKAQGRVALPRNTPSLLNAGYQRWQGWDGAADSLWSQALRALTDPREMRATPAHLAARVRSDPAYARWHAQAFGRVPADDQALMVQLAKAIGAYTATLVSPRTPFDAFRDALARGDTAAGAAHYPLAAQRGLRLFIGSGRCTLCHGGPAFTNGEFADTGLPHFAQPGVADAGRWGGIATLRSSAYNLLGPWSDARDPAVATATRHVAAQQRNFGEFKVPGLRGVAETAPYMHDGQLPTLEAVVRHYSELDIERLHADGELILRPLHLSAGEQADLVAFLRSLSAELPPKPGR